MLLEMLLDMPWRCYCTLYSLQQHAVLVHVVAATSLPSSQALSSLAKRVSTTEARYNSMVPIVDIVFACLLDTVLDSGIFGCNDSYKILAERVCCECNSCCNNTRVVY